MLHITECPTVAAAENPTIPTGMTELRSLKNMEVSNGEILDLTKREEDQDLGVEVDISLPVTSTTISLVNSSETTAGLNQDVREDQETEEKMIE